MNISQRDITIIVIIFLIFVLYLYYTKSIESFKSNKPLENTYQDAIEYIYDNIENELNVIKDSSDVMKSVCNILKNNSYNLKKISQSKNLRVKINFLVKENTTMITYFNNIISKVENNNMNNNMFTTIKKIYIAKKELQEIYLETDKNLLSVLNLLGKNKWTSHTEINSIFDDFNSAEVNKSIKELYQKIDTEINNLAGVIDASILEDSFKTKFKNVFLEMKDLNKNLHIRNDTFNLYHTINRLHELYQQKKSFSLSSNFINSYNTSIDTYKVNMTGSINKNIEDIKKLVSDKPSNVLSNDVEVNYLNTVDVNNEIVHNFCKKINKLDKPNENNLMFIRFSKEFVDKKNKHIERLQKEIDTIQQQLYNEEVNDFNSNKLRINDQASKQYKAIMKAKENIENSKKFKVNIS